MGQMDGSSESLVLSVVHAFAEPVRLQVFGSETCDYMACLVPEWCINKFIATVNILPRLYKYTTDQVVATSTIGHPFL